MITLLLGFTSKYTVSLGVFPVLSNSKVAAYVILFTNSANAPALLVSNAIPKAPLTSFARSLFFKATTAPIIVSTCLSSNVLFHTGIAMNTPFCFVGKITAILPSDAKASLSANITPSNASPLAVCQIPPLAITRGIFLWSGIDSLRGKNTVLGIPPSVWCTLTKGLPAVTSVITDSTDCPGELTIALRIVRISFF